MKQNSSILKLSWIRIKKEPAIWILSVVCLYIVIAYYFDEVKIPSPFSQSTVDAINIIAFSLSCSYIAGMIFYIISEFRIQTRKARAVLANAVEDLRLFKDDFSELSRKIWGDDWLTALDTEESVFREIAKFDYSINSENNLIEIPKSLVRLLKDYISKFDYYLKSAMSYEPYFSPEEYQKMTEIRMSFAFSQVRIHFDETNGTYYNSKTLMAFINNIIEVNRKTVLLYVELQRYGYDSQK